ncbi:MAG: DUF3810 domain-containing protein [Clostridia bacterium]|nr:DUF3810 domain-containing protein [Clostridia bacterium]
MEQRVKEKIKFRDLCPVRLIVTLTALLTAAFYYLFRGNTVLMEWVYYSVTKPCHAFVSKLCGYVSFSVAELIVAVAIIFAIVYIIVSIILLLFKKKKKKRVYITLLTLVMLASLFWSGFSVLWGVCYYVPSFADRSGLDDGPVSVSDLIAVTEYFAAAAGEYGENVVRGENGVFAVSREDILDRSAENFRGASALFPFLEGEELRPKAIAFSKVLSAMNFTGFFFPLTGEANLNVDSPICMLPATAEHELSHQRGIAEEQEANFIAVLACMESEDKDFAYSGALMAYIYLGNALYSADYDAWQEVRCTLSDYVVADLSDINSYWAKYSDTSVKKASDKVYEAFLQSNGQELGLKSYGACVDLLVNYYYPLCYTD